MNIQKIISFAGSRVNAVFYNDSHGQIKNVPGFFGARDEFFKERKNDLNLTLSGGDVFLDASRLNPLVADILVRNTDALAVGNHDVGSGEGYLNGLIEKFDLQKKFISSNMNFNDKKLRENVPKSKIIVKNGEKIGIVALSPSDYRKHAYNTKQNQTLEVEDFEQSLSSLKREVKKLEKKGVNKIFLLAHTGEFGENSENLYEKYAHLGGIDVIIGGHDHREVNRMELSKRGEPVIIVSTGRSANHGFEENLDYFGMLELDFDDKGVLNLLNCKSKILKTPKTDKHSEIKGKTIYTLPKPMTETNRMTGHSETANLVADSNLWYVNTHTKTNKADFAFVNPGTIRDIFENKEITEEQVASILPFTTSKLVKVPITKAQIIKTLEHCARTAKAERKYPGIMQVSGMEYTVKPDCSVKDVHILNPDGSIKYNLDDFDDDKIFTGVYDTFLMTGVAGLTELKREENDSSVEVFDISRQEVLIEYLTKAEKISDYTQKRIKK
ncbi:bifunctional metallophosphatase/5'-nucleotidase [bacterium]|nr:bifunctional metallophosphatase/5'-nucleotidase [bacterium]